MKQQDVKKIAEFRNSIARMIISYYRSPSDSKLRIIFFDASRLRRMLHDDDWYQMEVKTICIEILYACNIAFVRSIESQLLIPKN